MASGRPIIVASLMRSGTHLLIDSLLNNCKELRRVPLYIDLDELLLECSHDEALELIARSGHYVIKTHYPQLGGNDPERAAFMASLCEMGTTITIMRDQASVERSFAIFSDQPEPRDMSDNYARFRGFWQARAQLALNFEDLTNDWQNTMDRIWTATGHKRDVSVTPPSPRNHRYRVYANKLLTRLIGRRAPVINTTIGFASRRKK